MFIKFGLFTRLTSYSFSLYIRWWRRFGCRYVMLIIPNHVRVIFLLLWIKPSWVDLDVQTTGYGFDG